MYVSLTPTTANFSYQNKQTVSHPNFTSIPPKNIVKNTTQELNYAQKMYKFMMLSKHEIIDKMQDGYVYTKQSFNKGMKIVSQKYKLWHRKPEAIVEDNYKTKLRKKTTFNKDKTFNLEYRDMNNPDYVVSVGYKNVKDTKKFDGTLSVNYCGKQHELSPDKRKELIDEYSDYIDNNIVPKKLPSLSEIEDVQKFLDNYYKSPEVIAKSILKSPDSLEYQLETVQASMPYGIESIVKKMEN